MPSDVIYQPDPSSRPSVIREADIETAFVEKFRGLKYEIRSDISSRLELERNFREKFEALNRVHLTDAEFARLLDEIVNLNISRYVTTSISEEEIDLEKTHSDLVAIEKKAQDAATKHNAYLKELGLPLIPYSGIGATKHKL